MDNISGLFVFVYILLIECRQEPTRARNLRGPTAEVVAMFASISAPAPRSFDRFRPFL
jgi:hypothetical protein